MKFSENLFAPVQNHDFNTQVSERVLANERDVWSNASRSNLDKTVLQLHSLTPILSSYTDKHNRVIQLWKSKFDEISANVTTIS